MGGPLSQKHMLADCWVVRTADLGLTDNTVHCRTFLGHILNVGDAVLGLDLKNSNVNNPELEKLSTDKIPDVVLVKKHFADPAAQVEAQAHGRLPPHGHSCNDEFNDFAADL